MHMPCPLMWPVHVITLDSFHCKIQRSNLPIEHSLRPESEYLRIAHGTFNFVKHDQFPLSPQFLFGSAEIQATPSGQCEVDEQVLTELLDSGRAVVQQVMY
jgi:hypothetical protein